MLSRFSTNPPIYENEVSLELRLSASARLRSYPIDEGRRSDGLANAEGEELVKLRRELRVAKLENEILKRAAAA